MAVFYSVRKSDGTVIPFQHVDENHLLGMLMDNTGYALPNRLHLSVEGIFIKQMPDGTIYQFNEVIVAG